MLLRGLNNVSLRYLPRSAKPLKYDALVRIFELYDSGIEISEVLQAENANLRIRIIKLALEGI